MNGNGDGVNDSFILATTIRPGGTWGGFFELLIFEHLFKQEKFYERENHGGFRF